MYEADCEQCVEEVEDKKNYEQSSQVPSKPPANGNEASDAEEVEG
ncbi:MAG: hypothetical protein AAF830_13870 [Pseudomonadota bacterium]